MIWQHSVVRALPLNLARATRACSVRVVRPGYRTGILAGTEGRRNEFALATVEYFAGFGDVNSCEAFHWHAEHIAEFALDRDETALAWL